jgi:hypothetical protein
MRVIGFNSAAENLLGYSSAEALGQRCGQILQAFFPTGEPLCSVLCEGQSCFVNGKKWSIRTCKIRHKTGQMISAGISTLVLPQEARENQSGEAVAIIFLRESAQGIENQQPRATPEGLTARGSYKDGSWQVVMTRPLTTETADTDLQFVEGKFVPIAFFAWDGSNSEAGTHHAMTTWYWLQLKPEAGSKPIIVGIIVALLIGGILVWWGRSAVARRRETSL